MNFAAIRFLDRILTNEMRVFEYGSGGSSLFFSHRVREVVSVEHDGAWANRVQEVVRQKRLTNVKILLISPDADRGAAERDPADPEGYVSSDDRFRAYSFRHYAASIESFAAGFFQVIVIDGRSRPSCFKHALPKVAVGGWLILDNAERLEYQCIHRALKAKDWEKFEFSGPGPHTPIFWQTCFWRRIV